MHGHIEEMLRSEDTRRHALLKEIDEEPAPLVDRVGRTAGITIGEGRKKSVSAEITIQLPDTPQDRAQVEGLLRMLEYTKEASEEGYEPADTTTT